MDKFVCGHPGPWMAVLLDEPGGRSVPPLAARREEAGRATIKHALERKTVYFDLIAGGTPAESFLSPTENLAV